MSIISGSLFLLVFISVVNPGKANVADNQWMSLLYFSAACAIASTAITDQTVMAWMELTRFAMAPALFLGVLYFTLPDKKFRAVGLLHFVPFLLFAVFALTPIISGSFQRDAPTRPGKTVPLFPTSLRRHLLLNES